MSEENEEKIISKEQIEAADKIYNQLHKWGEANKFIINFFKKNPKNKDIEIVLMKVLLISGLYKVYLENPDAIELAKKIVNIEDLDENIDKDKLKACISIAECEIEEHKKKFLMSFATKYVHFNTKKNFPIFDKYVGIALDISENTKKNKELLKTFYDRMKELVKNNNFEEIDKFFWLYGQKSELDKGKRKINKEVRGLYDSKPELFKGLDFKEE